jgi:serine/threonine-protein kinase RsbW
MSSAAGDCGSIELRMDARPENLAYARLALAGIAASVEASREVVADLKLAVTEACSNVIQHAYLDGGGGDEIVVRYELREGELAVEVQDWGVGFDASRPISYPPGLEGDSSVDGEALPPEHGMGLLIIRAVTDELTIASSGAGSRVGFVRRLDPDG